MKQTKKKLKQNLNNLCFSIVPVWTSEMHGPNWIVDTSKCIKLYLMFWLGGNNAEER